MDGARSEIDMDRCGVPPPDCGGVGGAGTAAGITPAVCGMPPIADCIDCIDMTGGRPAINGGLAISPIGSINGLTIPKPTVEAGVG